MGATYCCSQHERKDFSTVYIKNLEVTGIENLSDLMSAECQPYYKNQSECSTRLTKDNLVSIFYNSLAHFKNLNFEKIDDFGVCSITKRGQGIDRHFATVFKQFTMKGHIKNYDLIQRAILNINDRKLWDKEIILLKQIGDIQSSNMVLLHQTQRTSDGDEQEMILKRFMFRKTGKVFMYQSSVPDEVYESPEYEG